MQIKNMFKKDIERNIKGVITVDKEKDNIYQELEEYVVTNELLKHFSEFFSVYNKGITNPTVDMGVWISGFFGSGKSHFLKILSFILDGNLVINGRKPLDFFIEDEKIKDPIVMANMENSSKVNADVILFNIDSKSSSQSNSNKDPILDVFYNAFNEMRGYSGNKPFLAELEKELDESNKYDDFKMEFEKLSGKSWDKKGKYSFKFERKHIIQSIINIGFMDKDDAKYWANNAEKTFEYSIEDFAIEVKEYCDKKGNNHHVVFLVDEVGQYIADDTKLMLNLQTIVEELGMKCKGKAWVIVTSQQNIDDITKDIRGIDFSKIQGRFKTRLSLSSSNVDEVIRRRILAKNDVAKQTLESEYDNVESILKNILSFEKSAEMKTYESAKNFAEIYPFVPYQFNLVQNVLTSIREHSASGKHLADGERSMLALFKESAIAVKDKEEDTLVPFSIFYNAIEEFLDNTYSMVIQKARDNNFLFDFDVEILKVLFMIKHVKEIKATSKNITTLMISNIGEDRLELNHKVDKSLKRLQEQTLIQKNGEIYSFLTNEEQDINREIKNQIVDDGEILDNAANRIFTEIYPKNKYKFSNSYNFPFNQSIDDKKINNREFDIGIRIITPSYEANLIDSAQTSFGEGNMHNILKSLSEKNNEVIIHLSNESLTVFDEIRESLQIHKFLTKKSADLKAELRARKQGEYNDKIERIKLFLESAIKESTIYVKGDKVDIAEKNIESRLDEAMGKLVDKVYNKLSYMDFAPDKSDIKYALTQDYQQVLVTNDSDCINALNDLDNYILEQSKISNTITLKNLLQRYSKAPHGFNNLDIQWLVATLFAQKKITLIMNSNELFLREIGAQKIFEYLTKTEFFEKLLIETRDTIDDKKIKAVKNVLDECYDLNIPFDNDEKIMDEFKRVNKLKLDVIDECISEFRIFDKYPGKKTLDEAKELFTDVDNKKNTSKFFNFVYEMEDDFKDISEYLEPILSFFQGRQKTIFEDSCAVWDVYESNRNLINDSLLSKKASEINKIIQMPSPYSNIRRLPELNKEFNFRFDQILADERTIIDNDINNDLNDVLSRLNNDELKNEFKNEVNSKFSRLKDKLNSQKNIAIIKGITTESKNLRDRFIKDIDNFTVVVPPTEPGELPASTLPKPIIKEVSVDIKKITSSSRLKIESEQEIDELLNKIKAKLKHELQNNDVVNLEL
ncbi:hypothetical protein MBORA_08840 [Methanobrevibacter oralis]|uniref:BREX system P-loop protein BrxC n=2 Tax=Methanobrevibacter oralis TaxID=66851 RepID=A0A166B7Q9_METOA|nr:BREX system P-loop protein BrxC [Methanobrevibacter oralis]KZX12983.1 hypothetical protein MBORA_08840 [Methanobrevibacter oralis]